MSRRDPIYQRLAGVLEKMIQSQSLRTGDRMPSVRQFSMQQGVSVPTSLQAYTLLESRGWIEARPKSGFFVRSRLADMAPEPVTKISRPQVTTMGDPNPVESMFSDYANDRLVPLGAAIPSAKRLPGVKLTRLMASVGRRLGDESIGYDPPPGSISLRRELSRRSLDWGCALQADEFLITIGATEAVSLALRAICEPGDTVVIESPTYFGLAGMLREMRLKALPVPVHPSDGLDLDVLERALRKNRVKACVVVPNFHNPTGSVTSDVHKKRLVEICSRNHIPLIEDDTYGDLPHVGPRPRCLKAFDQEGIVILCGSFSKKLAPGYRVGYIAAGSWQGRIRSLKQASTLSGTLLTSLTISEFLKTGGYDRYLRSICHAYRLQTERMREALAASLPDGSALSRPQGGYILWCQLPGGVDAMELYHQARSSGIGIAPGPLFSPVGGFRDCFRINCGHPWDPVIERAVKTLGRIAKRLAAP